MTFAGVDTGEVVEILSESQARRVVARINGTTAELLDLIEQAWKGQAWIALGYRSWDDLCEQEITIPRLDREQRREMVGALRTVGMSTRAIGAAAGIAHDTVRRDLASGGRNRPPHGEPTPDVEPFVEKAHQPRPEPKITGTDGKTYPASPPADTKPRRPSLTDAAQKAGWDLRRAIERVERICADDRFPTHREQVAVALHSHLSYVAEVMPDLLDATQQSLED